MWMATCLRAVGFTALLTVHFSWLHSLAASLLQLLQLIALSLEFSLPFRLIHFEPRVLASSAVERAGRDTERTTAVVYPGSCFMLFDDDDGCYAVNRFFMVKSPYC